MGFYNKVPDDVLECIAKNAGILLSDFDTQSWTFRTTDIKGATTGGINFKDAPTYDDYGKDIDNMPKNTKEMKYILSRDVTTSGTFVSARKAEIKNIVAASDMSGDKITPRDELKAEDFGDHIWFVTDYGDGGAIAIRLDNVLNEDGFSMATLDKDKTKFAFNYKAHYSLDDPKKVPYEIFVKEGAS